MKRACLIVAVSVVVLGANAQGADKANTKVLFGGANPVTGGTDYFGNIESPKRACANKRRVSVYMKGKGPDEKVASDKSQPGKGDTFYWQAREEGPPLAGTYYAKARETDDCRGDRSKDFLYARKARQGVETEVATVLAYLPDTDQRFYAAGLSATKHRCVPDRKVSFFEKLPGDDRLIGRERSDEAGEASVEESPAPPFGDSVFYVKVKRREVGDLVCKRARSPMGSGARAAIAPRARAQTEVILDGIAYNSTTGRTEINGRVDSPRKDCAKDRKITVYREADGADVKYGSDRAKKDGGDFKWFITKGGLAPAGNYYAKAEPGDTCKGDKSNVVFWN